MIQTELNNPDTRQDLLRARLSRGDALVAAALSREFDVSIDTIRRDLLALEEAGAVRRVRGGAVPVSAPVRPFHERLPNADTVPTGLVHAAVSQIRTGMVAMLDGGATVLAVAQAMPANIDCLIVTPSPAIALAALGKGIRTQLIGGMLSASGGIAVGADAERAIADVAADLCMLGACGIDARFGLSADNYEERGIKRAMALASNRCVIVATEDKLGRKARHRVLRCNEVDQVITDASPLAVEAFSNSGIELTHV